MLAAALLTSSFLLLGNNNGGGCEFGSGSVRAYAIPNPGLLIDCPPPTQIDENTNTTTQQNAFLIQYLSTTLTSEGFRTTLRPLNGETANFARIAATDPQNSLTPPTMSTDSRYYTKLRDDASEVVLSVTGNAFSGYTLMATHHYMDGAWFVQAGTFSANLLPSDFTSAGVLELDTRVNNDNSVSGDRGSIRIQVCTRRGTGNCHVFSILNKFGQLTAPEFYLGTFMRASDFSTLRARYCHLPPFTAESSGYTNSCPGQMTAQ